VLGDLVTAHTRVVEWTPPEERRGLDVSTDIRSLVVALTTDGTPAAMKRAAAAYRKRSPKAHVHVQGKHRKGKDGTPPEE
jgi:hypothetical protein